jgi:hypothetical protein
VSTPRREGGGVPASLGITEVPHSHQRAAKVDRLLWKLTDPSYLAEREVTSPECRGAWARSADRDHRMHRQRDSGDALEPTKRRVPVTPLDKASEVLARCRAPGRRRSPLARSRPGTARAGGPSGRVGRSCDPRRRPRSPRSPARPAGRADALAGGPGAAASAYGPSRRSNATNP